ncbi:ATP phosphoribosyltransferase [Thiohalospira halophila DSM 15071]|uniref:ATP phosphoribosyltransferase n=1 Tax=Thiohalospira halophila DSM 15071 TaxID=1123397 RepID=A0A1I1QTP1_9GAMM|nr:ATP phosphoribosyltransferase [Thiohalospira halophila]SFD25481.1 ATP phosphoribosyltransferase [Thiohalospira halophila DSM 15071]
MAEPITLALSKGRIFEETVPLLRHAGIEPAEDPESSRRLILETNRPGVRIVIVRASDVPTYVQYGAADIGVAGKDVLMEHGGDGLYEPVDLGIAACRLMVAGRAGEAEPPRGRRRIATKYVHTTRRYYAEKGEQVEIIKLYGSMELAPLVGLADAIVDVVDTGNTLRANGLEPQEHIADISSRLVVNRAAMKVKHDALGGIISAFREAVGGE